MVLLIDTNIVLDVLLNRPEFVKDSSMIWKLCETEQAKGYISTSLQRTGLAGGFRPVLKQKPDDRAYIVNEISTIVW